MAQAAALEYLTVEHHDTLLPHQRQLLDAFSLFVQTPGQVAELLSLTPDNLALELTARKAVLSPREEVKI